MSKFAQIQEREKQAPSVLNTWKAQNGPETIRNENETRQNLTVQELANLIGSGYTSAAGAVVNENTAMRVSAVYACVALISGAISTLPLPIYERTNTNGQPGRKKVDHPYYWILNEQPDDNISAAVFWEYMVSSRLFYGDCFAEIKRSSYRSNKIVGLEAHHPLRVNPFRDSEGNVWYRVTPVIGAQYVVHPADMLHIPSLGFDGLTSPSPITYAARQAVGTSIATAEYNGKFFANGARPDFALKTANNLSRDQADMLRSTWTNRHGGTSNAHLPAILTGGLEVQQLTMSAVDSQILATCSWNLEEICRVLGVPPFMVGSTEKTTSWGTGQENMGRGFVKYTLLRDLRKFEQEINRKFWPMRETYFVEFDVSGIERGDLKTENEALRVALGRAGEPGWISVNEVRHLKLLPPIEGGDKVATAIEPANPDAKSADQTANNLEIARIFAESSKPAQIHMAAPVVNLPAQTININSSEIENGVINALDKMADSYSEKIKAIGEEMPINITMPEQPAPQVVVNVENKVPEQVVPIVNVTNTVPAVQQIEITSLPDRKTTTDIIRDDKGNITESYHIESDL